jgi:hypothetical protein
VADMTRLLTDRERQLIAFRVTNPHLSVRQITSMLLLQPGELTRLLQLKKGRRLWHDLTWGRSDLPWQNYRLSPKLYLRAITTPEK